MFIPRNLGIHVCSKCKEKLIDSSFTRCGITLQGDSKWKVFFQYDCPHCKKGGLYIVKGQKNDLPGDIFRQFGNALDAKYFQDTDADAPNIDDFLLDP